MQHLLAAAEPLVYFESAAACVFLGFALGAAFGSFFNVVAYRLPRGMNLSRPPSRCPACGKPIRWHDNVPIFGWLMLRGRCRDCRSPISYRYPLVELLVAVASAAVAASALGPRAAVDGREVIAFYPLLMVFRLAPLYVLMCAALIEFDGHPPPRTLWIALAVVLAAGLAAVTLWPDLQRLGEVTSRWSGLISGAWGLAAGVLLAALAWPMLIGPASDPRLGLVRSSELALAGTFLGSAAVAVVAVIAAAVFLATQTASRRAPQAGRFGWASALVLGTLVWTLAGAVLRQRWPQLLESWPPRTLVLCGAVVAVLAIAHRAARGRPGSTENA